MNVSLEDLHEGQTMLMRVVEDGDATVDSNDRRQHRVIRLSAIAESTSCVEDVDVGRLLPGTIVLVEPLKSTSKGVYVMIGTKGWRLMLINCIFTM